MASDSQGTGQVFIPIAGEAPGPGGLLVGINPAAVAFAFGSWDKSLKKNVLRLHMASGKTVQVEDEDVPYDVLEWLGLAEPSGSSGSRA
jgi:hypothetical protein